MEKINQEEIRHKMAVAYFNIVKQREADLLQQLENAKKELEVCGEALNDLKTVTDVSNKVVEQD